MIDFSTLQGLTIPEGVVTQIAKDGVVLWALQSDKPIILEVEKITADTYAGETTYTGEQFILLDIYPKTNGTVNVTYGGLTKTITDTSGAEEPNAQKVYFGTFNGVSDSVTTPASGELTIEGDYYAFEKGTFYRDKTISVAYYGITGVQSFGSVTTIIGNAFGCSVLDSPEYRHSMLESIRIPKTITVIGLNPFMGIDTLDLSCDAGNQHYKVDGKCLIEKEGNTLISGFSDSIIPSYVTKLRMDCFAYNKSLTSMVVPAGVTTIEVGAFLVCKNLSTLTMLATTPPTISQSLISTGEGYNTTIIVPKGCGEAYKTAEYWIKYADRIVEAS